jgi:hypothetical protein
MQSQPERRGKFPAEKNSESQANIWAGAFLANPVHLATFHENRLDMAVDCGISQEAALVTLTQLSELDSRGELSFLKKFAYERQLFDHTGSPTKDTTQNLLNDDQRKLEEIAEEFDRIGAIAHKYTLKDEIKGPLKANISYLAYALRHSNIRDLEKISELRNLESAVSLEDKNIALPDTMHHEPASSNEKNGQRLHDIFVKILNALGFAARGTRDIADISNNIDDLFG